MGLDKVFRKVFGTSLSEGLDFAPSSKVETIKAYPIERETFELGENGLETSTDVSWTFTDPRAYTVPPDTVTLADGKLELETIGWDGTTYTNGVAYRGPNGEKDIPSVWRGKRRDYGLAHTLFTQSTVYQRPVFDIFFALSGSPFNVEPADVDALLEDAAKAQAWEIEDTLNALEGGLSGFLAEAVYALCVPGWGMWQRIHWPDGRLRKLAYRRANALDGVLLNEAETEIIAFRMLDSKGATYTIDAADVLVISFMALGLDIEGLSPWRAGCEYERGKQLLLELFFLSAEKHGTPQDVVEATGDYKPNKDDSLAVANALDSRRAQDPTAIIMPKGLVAKVLSPSGSMPQFLEMIRYCDEMQTVPLSSEGALFTGTSGAGSYAALETKDRQRLGVAEAIGRIICAALNGEGRLKYQGPLRSQVDATGGPLEPERYPKVKINLFSDEEASLDELIRAKDAGFVVVDRGVQEEIHRRYKLPMPAEVQAPAAPVAAPTVAPPIAAHDCGHTCGHTSEGPEDDVSIMLAEQLDLFKRAFDADDGQRSIDGANDLIGKALESVAKRHREDWVAASSGMSFDELMGLRETMRSTWLPVYRREVAPHVAELAAKGALSLAYQLGLVAKVPARIKDAPLSPVAVATADQIALKSYNIVESYLLETGMLEANGLPERKRPPMPTASAFVKQAAAITAPAFAVTRNEAVEELMASARRFAPPGKKPKIIAEYSSVMESGTCEPCKKLDGRRFFVGSKLYETYKPPSVCEGGSRCRCIMTYLANEADFEDIYQELERGFSQTSNAVKLAESDTVGIVWSRAALSWARRAEQ